MIEWNYLFDISGDTVYFISATDEITVGLNYNTYYHEYDSFYDIDRRGIGIIHYLHFEARYFIL